MMRILQQERQFSLALAIVFLLAGMFGFTAYGAKRDRIMPSAPTNLQAGSVSATDITLTWTRSTDNIGVTGYNIYRDNIFIGKVASNTYISTGLQPAKTYMFYVKAVDAAGNLSPSSNVLSVTTAGETSTPAKKVIGYYASWGAYSGYTPDKLDASKLTHINYAFANIGSDLKIAMGSPDVDPSNFTKLSALKVSYPNLKTLISVGGWSWSGKFSDVALTDASRTAFSDSCVAFILKYGFNGIDIDWEYPVSGGEATNIHRPEDKHNFTLLLQKLREKLNAQSTADGKKYLLTIAGASDQWYINNTELGLANQYLDFANIMTYDIHGTWDQYTDFNAPLYNNTDTSPQYKWSVDASVNAWLKTGIPAEKLIVGVPFYGHKYVSVKNFNNGLYQTFTGGSALGYSAIVSGYLNTPGYVCYFHQQSMVPWLFNGSTFISYDDPQSIGYKAQYIRTKALGGAAIWELSQDPEKVLLTALYNGLK